MDSLWNFVWNIFKLAGIYSRNIIMSRNMNQIPARNLARNMEQIPARIPGRINSKILL